MLPRRRLQSRDLDIQIQERNPETLDDAVSRVIQLESIYEAQSGSKSPETLVHAVNQHDKQHKLTTTTRHDVTMPTQLCWNATPLL